MKKFIFSTILCSLVAFAGCHNEDLHIEKNKAQKVVVTANIEGGKGSRVDLTASEDSNGNPFVKVDWKASGETFWVRGDGNDSEYYMFTQIEGNRFEGTLPSDVFSIYYAYYPQTYNITQQDGTLNEDNIVMTGYCEKDTNPVVFTFIHETIILKPTFKIKDLNINSTIKSIYVDNVKYPNSADHSQSRITVTPNAQDDIYIFIPMLYDGSDDHYPAGHEFSFQITTEDDTIYKTNLTIPVALERGKFYTATINLGNTICYMPEGYKFREQINSYINGTVKHIKFVVNSEKTGEEIVDTDAKKAYLVVSGDGQTLEVHTSGHKFFFNADSSDMFSADTDEYSNLKYLSSIDFANCDTSMVTDMADMFSNCTNLMVLTNIANFNTSKVTDMSYMFYHCGYAFKSQISQIGGITFDLRNFDTSNVINMDSMFSGCVACQILVDTEKFVTSKVTNMRAMFRDVTNLTSLDFVKTFDTSKVTDMSSMFSSLYITSLDVSNFDTSNVTNMGSMFSSLPNITSLNLSNFNTLKVTNMSHMFNDCKKLEKLDLSNFSFNAALEAHDGTNYKGIYYIFYNVGVDYKDADNKSTVIKVYSGEVANNLRNASHSGLDTNSGIEFRNRNYDIV